MADEPDKAGIHEKAKTIVSLYSYDQWMPAAAGVELARAVIADNEKALRGRFLRPDGVWAERVWLDGRPFDRVTLSVDLDGVEHEGLLEPWKPPEAA